MTLMTLKKIFFANVIDGEAMVELVGSYQKLAQKGIK